MTPAVPAAHRPLLLALAGLLLAALVYLPGLGGPWLLDDFQNLSVFQDYKPGAAPYHDLVLDNGAGPLGRPVAMASFAANHAAGLFSPLALKATNLVLHLACGAVLFLLLRRLLRRRPVATRLALGSDALAALLSVWWLLLPLQLSTVLYTVQRMTILASLFSLAACLAYAQARDAWSASRPRAIAALAACVASLVAAMLAKESAAVTLAWLVLIELFFFQPARARAWATGLVLAVALPLLLLGLATPAVLARTYEWRDFTLAERLLSEARVLWAYAGAIFLPDGSLGVFHDDFAISRGWFTPISTLPAVVGLTAATALALRAAASERWWPAAFGLLFFLAGHLVESTVISLEIYFEHRNYLPAAGLLLVAATAALNVWPWPSRLLAAACGAYLLSLALVTGLGAMDWGDEGRLLERTVRHHPHSMRAWTSLGELAFTQAPVTGLQVAAQAVANDPEQADVYYLQMISMYCRSASTPPPPPLVAAAGTALGRAHGREQALRIGLVEILDRQQRGKCGDADFRPLLPGLLAYDTTLVARWGEAGPLAWPTRTAVAQWLAVAGDREAARQRLDAMWSRGRREDMPTVGLALAKVLAADAHRAPLAQVLRELAAVTADAPPEFRQEMLELEHTLQDMP